MAANIEIRNGVASFAENGRRERAWHGLGDDQQIFDRPMFVKEALEACHANYDVKLTPVVALSDALVAAMDNGDFINAAMLRELLVDNTKATIRTDTNESLGIVSDKYGVVPNSTAFEFVDKFCSGELTDREHTPVIETCGVLGHGERVFITAKMPNKIVLDAKRDDLVEMYVVFTTSHDGTGAVRCVCTPIRVVCNNTLQLALKENIGRLSFRHSSKVLNRMDLLNKENAEFAYKALNMADLYTQHFEQAFKHLRNIKLSEKELDNILAEMALADQAKKVFFETRNIFHEDIATRGRNIFLGMKDCLENGVGQEGQEKGTAQWALNGITSYYQNVQNFKDNETKFDSILDGSVSKKVQKAYDMMVAA